MSPSPALPLHASTWRHGVSPASYAPRCTIIIVRQRSTVSVRHWQHYAERDTQAQRESEAMAERKSIGTMHVFWKEQEGAPGGAYIETHNDYRETVDDSRQTDCAGPPHKN